MLGKEAFDIIFNDTLINSSTIHGAIVVIDDKIWMDKHYGRFIFSNREAAMKAFYNCMKWYVSHTAFRHSTENVHRYDPYYRWSYIGEGGYIFSSDEYSICRNWRRFKKDLIDNHNFQIIEI